MKYILLFPESRQQWDFPNVWPPLVELTVRHSGDQLVQQSDSPSVSQSFGQWDFPNVWPLLEELTVRMSTKLKLVLKLLEEYINN